MIKKKCVEIKVGNINHSRIKPFVPDVSVGDRVFLDQKLCVEHRIGSNTLVDLVCDHCQSDYQAPIRRLFYDPRKVSNCQKCMGKIGTAKMTATKNTPEAKTENSIRMKEIHSRPGVKEKYRQHAKKMSYFLKHTPEGRAHSKKMVASIKNRPRGEAHWKYNPNKDMYKEYSDQVHKLTRIVYRNYKNEINPEDIPISMFEYHVDHVQSIKECFLKGYSPEFCSRKENLQVLSSTENRSKSCSFLEGDNIFWITDGEKNQKWCMTAGPIPDGWSKGKTTDTEYTKIKKVWITNGIKNTMIPTTHDIPDGWKVGMTAKRNTGKIWINNGIRNKLIVSHQQPPKGWGRGKIRINAQENNHAF